MGCACYRSGSLLYGRKSGPDVQLTWFGAEGQEKWAACRREVGCSRSVFISQHCYSSIRVPAVSDQQKVQRGDSAAANSVRGWKK